MVIDIIGRTNAQDNLNAYITVSEEHSGNIELLRGLALRSADCPYTSETGRSRATGRDGSR